MIILIHIKNACVNHKKIIKPYFNIWYIKFFYLLQKNIYNIKLNKKIYNINVLMKIFINLYNNSGVNCNNKKKKKYNTRFVY